MVRGLLEQILEASPGVLDRLLGADAVFGPILTDDDALSLKRLLEGFCQSPSGATSHGSGLDEQRGQTRDRLQESVPNRCGVV
ncbi:hypothetical protein Tco_1522431 [Tanacetum coccineum]